MRSLFRRPDMVISAMGLVLLTLTLGVGLAHLGNQPTCEQRGGVSRFRYNAVSLVMVNGAVISNVTPVYECELPSDGETDPFAFAQGEQQ